MATRTFELLKSRAGALASVNGATQIRAGVLRPEVVIPHEIVSGVSAEEISSTLEIGATVRIIRDPYFGKVGSVTGLPVALQKLETEAEVRVATVRLQNGDEVTLPRANLELVQGA